MLGSKLILELGPYIILVSSSFQKIASVTVLLVFGMKECYCANPSENVCSN